MVAFNEIERKKDELKEKLLALGYFKPADGKQLYELSLHELIGIYREVRGNATGNHPQENKAGSRASCGRIMQKEQSSMSCWQ